jgi:hypothetical protein
VVSGQREQDGIAFVVVACFATALESTGVPSQRPADRDTHSDDGQAEDPDS